MKLFLTFICAYIKSQTDTQGFYKVVPLIIDGQNLYYVYIKSKYVFSAAWVLLWLKSCQIAQILEQRFYSALKVADLPWSRTEKLLVFFVCAKMFLITIQKPTNLKYLKVSNVKLYVHMTKPEPLKLIITPPTV